MLEIGMSVGISANDEEEMRKISESGIKNIEISFGDLNKLNDFDFNGAKQLSEKYGIKLWSYHLPFAPFEKIDISSLDVEKSDFTFSTFMDLIKKGTSIGIDKFVVHPSAEPIPEGERKERLKAAAEFLSKLADEAQKYGAVIAVEDLPRSCLGNCSDEILYLLNANDKLCVCFDTNHLLNEKQVDFINKIGSKIITLHVSDYDYVNERHWLPGEGDINWKELVDSLLKIGYDGVWLYELALEPPKTINRRKLTYVDFYNNAVEILNGKRPTPIGKRIEI